MVAPRTDGAMLLYIGPVDAVGNVGASSAIEWVVDTVPPETNATIISSTVYVPELDASAISTTYLTLYVLSSEPSFSSPAMFKVQHSTFAGR